VNILALSEHHLVCMQTIPRNTASAPGVETLTNWKTSRSNTTDSPSPLTAPAPPLGQSFLIPQVAVSESWAWLISEHP